MDEMTIKLLEMDETTKAERVHPLDLSEFKNFDSTIIINIPEKIENRVPTDRLCLFIFVGCVIFLMPLLTYVLWYSDIRKIDGLGNIDDCGNVCGYANIKYEQWNCTGQNFTDKKFAQIVGIKTKRGIINEQRECVKECSANYTEIGWFCISQENIITYIQAEGVEYLLRDTTICRFILSFLISVGVSFLVVNLFMRSIDVMVWAIIVCSFILYSIVVGCAWAFYIYVKNLELQEYRDGNIYTYILCVCSLSTLFLLIYAAAVYFLRDKIKPLILLLKETTTAIRTVPSLVIVRISTFLADTIIVILFLITTVYMFTVGELTEESPGKLYYDMTLVQMLIIIFNSIVTVWALCFIDGLQYTITGGVVSEWYFARDKTKLVQPLKNTAIMVCKCHLGSIALGSSMLLVAQIILYFLKSVLRPICVNACLSCWIRCTESLLEFITRRAYIVIAMHGQPFYKSGKRAAKLFIENVCNVSTVTVIETFIYAVTVLLIAIITVLISSCLFLSDIEDHWEYVTVALTIIFLLALFVGINFITLFKTTTDTIFMCFCEDTIINDGMTRPYAMSTDLMKFIEISKKQIGIQSFIPSDSAISYIRI